MNKLKVAEIRKKVYVTVNELFEYHEKEKEIMEVSKQQ